MPNFSVCLIAKNEEKTLHRLMNSLAEFTARGGKTLLLDTGSTDKTVEVAKSFGIEVHEVGDKFVTVFDVELANKINFEFVSLNGNFGIHSYAEEGIVKEGDKLFDYSSARNYIAEFAPTDMIATPDCDEAYTKLDIDKVNQIIADGAEQLEYNFVFSHFPDGSPAIKFKHCKFYNRKKLKWVNKIHEVLAGEAKRVELGEDVIYLEHFQNHETNRSGYLKGLALDCYLNPTNDRNSHYFGRELLYTGRPRSAIKELERHLTLSKWPAERGQSMIYIGDAEMMLGNEQKAIEWYFKAFNEEPNRREPLIRLAEHFYKKNDYLRTAVYAEACLPIQNSNFYANFQEHYTYKPHEYLYWAYWYLGDKEKSKYHFEKALAYAPQNPKFLAEAHFYLPPKTPKVSIVVPTLGRTEKLQRLLKGIKSEAGYANYEVIVIHDGEVAANIDYFGANVMWNALRQGVPKTLKRGVEFSNGELVMFLANDIIPQKDFLKNAVAKMVETFPELDGLVGLNDMYWENGEIFTHFLASKKLLPYLDGEFFHCGYKHTACDNELKARCEQIGKAVWAENAKVYHDHPVQNDWKDGMDKVYQIAYNKENMEHDRKLLIARSELLGFPYTAGIKRKLKYPSVHPSINLLTKLEGLPLEELTVLNLGMGDGGSGLACQLPFLPFKKITNVDIHLPYLEEAKKRTWAAKEVEYVNKDIREVENFNYNLVFAFDILEHLPKEESIAILRKMKNAMIFIPLEKEFRDNTTGVKEQDHLSFWIEQEFKDLGFHTEVLKNFHGTFDALWAIK